MSRDDPILRVRIPDNLRATLKARAEAKRRTMTQEIVDRLQASVDAEDASPISHAALAGGGQDLRYEVENLHLIIKGLETRLYNLESFLPSASEGDNPK